MIDSTVVDPIFTALKQFLADLEDVESVITTSSYNKVAILLSLRWTLAFYMSLHFNTSLRLVLHPKFYRALGQEA